MNQEYDVIVVGGGPGGSTTAGLLAKAGHNVLLVEREKFPRYHIGESLVPGIISILAELGLDKEAEQQGFTIKNGITLRWGAHREPWTVHFGEVGPFKNAYQVVRAQFDDMLLRNARRLGATVLEETRVVDFDFEAGRCVGITYARAGSGEPNMRARAKLVVDASGQAHLLARKLNLIEWDESLKNVAAWAYFDKLDFYPGRNAGNILVENMPDGWLWTIPLHDGTYSVGWVCPMDRALERASRMGDMLLTKIQESVETKRIMRDARQVSAFHTTKDWSYKCKQFHGPGYLLVGDAAGFVDPLFSTGVFLAMNGGSLAAKMIKYMLEQPQAELALGEQYQQAYRKFLDVVFSFVHYFYDASKDKEMYWDEAKKLIDPIGQMGSREDFVYLISGLGGVHSVLNLNPNEALANLSEVDQPHKKAPASKADARPVAEPAE